MGIPIYSRGSFRVQCVAMNSYLVRKCDFYWPHILTIGLMPMVCVPLVFWAVYYKVHQK
jgi:hypothetical protein